MTHHGGRWASTGVRFYYLLGSAYYIHKWLVYFGVGGVLTGVTAYLWDYRFALIAAFIFALSIASLCLGVWLWIDDARRRYQSANPGLQIKRVEAIYRNLGGGKYEYTRRMEVVAKFQGVEGFRHKFGWTGGGRIEVRTDPSCIATLGDNDRIWNKVLIAFPRPLAKGEIFTCYYTLSMLDTVNTAQKFLRMTLDDKSEHLSQTVILQSADRPVSFRRLMYVTQTSEIPVFEETVQLSPDKIVGWEIPWPRPNFVYGIYW